MISGPPTDEKVDGPYPTLVSNVYIVQGKERGKYVGDIILNFTGSSITHTEGAPQLVLANDTKQISGKYY